MHQVVQARLLTNPQSHSSSPHKSSSSAVSPPPSPLPSPSLAPFSSPSGLISSTSHLRSHAASLANPCYAVRSPFLDSRVLLLARLASVAFLLGHFVFFLCDNLLPVRSYSSWAFGVFTLSQLFSVFGSLLEILHDDESDRDLQNDGNFANTDVSSNDNRGKKSQVDNEIGKAANRIYPQLDKHVVDIANADIVSYHEASLSPPALVLNSDASVKSAQLDLEKQSCAAENSSRPLASALAAVRVPVQQVSLATAILTIIAYWGALRTADDSPSYVSIAQNVIAPVICILDPGITCCLHFSLSLALPLYIVLHLAYGTAYAVVVVVLERADPYPFFDPEIVPRNVLVARAVGISVACLAVPLGLHVFVKIVSRVLVRRKWVTATATKCEVGAGGGGVTECVNTKENSETDGSSLPGKTTAVPSKSTESRTTDPSASEHEASHPSFGPDDDDLTSSRHAADHRFLLLHRPRSHGGGAGGDDRDDDDRESAPLSRDARWYRSGSGVMTTSTSGSSAASVPYGNDNSGNGWNRRRARSDNEQNTSWSALDSPPPRIEDEYFKMPAVFEAHGLQRDIVRLSPSMQRSDSNRSGRSSVFSRAGSVIRSSTSRISPIHSPSASDESSPQLTSSRVQQYSIPDELSALDDVIHTP